MKFMILSDPSLVIIASYLICLTHALVKTRRGEEILQVQYMTMPQHKNPLPVGNQIYNFGRLFLGHHYYTLSLFYLCLSEEKIFFKEIMQIHYMTYTRPSTRIPALGVMIFTGLVDPSLNIITIPSICLTCAWE